MSLPRAGVRSDFRRFEELEHEIEELGHEIEELEHEIEELEDEIEELEEELEHEIEKLKIMLVEKTGYGVLSGLEVTAQDEPDMSVNVSEGIIYMQDGERFEVEADTMPVVEADAENPRIDIIYINGTGEVSYYPGTAAAVPEAPETPSGSQLLAEIEVAADATAIETENITDKRKLLDDEVDLLSERITNHYITGTYAGNGTTSDVVLSFEPCMVVIQNSLSPTAYTIIKGYDCKDSETVLGQITETGFTVFDVLNTDATTYNYIAFK